MCPREGWVEQDPLQILKAVKDCVEITVDNLHKLDIDPSDIVAVGITNQRETVVIWDRCTGQPLYNAIVWLDVRTTSTVDEVLVDVRDHNQDCLKSLCGLPVSTYFSAVKIRWLMDNVPEVKRAVERKRCCFGTMDTWLLWNLTGGKDGGLYITDVTNASRTMLMNIKTLQWDSTLCKFFRIPMDLLPEIRSSSEIYGYLTDGSLQGVPISGCLGDQQSALVGQMCFRQGQAKNTYGTGCFLLYNTGLSVVQSTHGLLTTVAYKLGKSANAVYALEGSVAICGAAMKWLRDNLRILGDISQSDKIAQSVTDRSEVYFVPAFSGLYAPFWRKDARSVICGITEDTTDVAIVRAALEAVCFQTRDILVAMNKDCGIPLTKLLVDGGMTTNNYVMQLQADLCGIPVVRPLMTETTALGAAMAAGSAEGIGVWDLNNLQGVGSDVFKPAISEDERDMKYSRWKMAIERSLGWVADEANGEMYEEDKQQYVLSSVPGSLFLITAAGLLLFAQYLRS
ncbi:glycerol kinase 3-like isoform X2 [Zootermopsis nevadensis]|uniref:Probable glycerol kinase n=2 Tax=Zootermopsis nevadensis TaxID=136037 RepID=A0A067RBQ4_ZOONE|nr:glycerol kinase 3-like isoform X2 [Zootermopsis nevadensis]KDR21321.1 Putative glycerol kinase 3 [Zootermopsis nevadensis]